MVVRTDNGEWMEFPVGAVEFLAGVYGRTIRVGGMPGGGLVAVGIHLHLRAIAESEFRDDHTWLAAFMSEAWDNHPDEYAAGVADSIEKVFSSVNDLYAAAEVLEADVDKPWTLPIYGGRPVATSADADPSNPPLMILEPPAVSQAADFLATVSLGTPLPDGCKTVGRWTSRVQ